MLNCWCITWPVGFKRLNSCVVGTLGTVLGPLAAANFGRCGYRIQERQVFSFVNIVLQGAAVWTQGLDMCAGLPSVVKTLFCEILPAGIPSSDICDILNRSMRNGMAVSRRNVCYWIFIRRYRHTVVRLVLAIMCLWFIFLVKNIPELPGTEGNWNCGVIYAIPRSNY